MQSLLIGTFSGLALVGIAALSGLTSSANAQHTGKGLLVAGRAADINIGGRLYDNHWSVLQREPPSKLNPLYPSKARAPGSSTWRCVTCHGWDYLGHKGHLGPGVGKHVFRSLARVVSRPPKEIARKLSKGSHKDLVAPLGSAQLLKLAMFLSHGQYDVSQVMNANGVARGNVLYGKDIYESACVTCHGRNGTEPIVGEKGDRSSLGWIARNRPQQAVHKIRNGVPSADMLSLRFLDLTSIADLLAYLQSLDRK